ncbi:hypothetical protein DERF_006260 [Dermatophagoides farinae]|uniref:Peptidase S1 domain-containing protein n=1 Tax=Dermatophagoides farinae TaxID=6954 RepID=A0A922I8J1_DERFA|nr:hypothetical protein DERF_006260 [Dermatophagoides farinae]
MIVVVVVVHGDDCVVDKTKLFQYRWHVSLQYYDQETGHLYHICDGAIVSSVDVIVPAYCVDLNLSNNETAIDTNDFRIKIINTFNPNVNPIYTISKIDLNLHWNPKTFAYNYAVIEIENEEFNLDSPGCNERPFVQIINTNLTGKIPIDWLNNKWATLSTWNWEHQNYEKNDVQIRFNDDCKNALSNSYRSIDIESEMCIFLTVEPCDLSNGALLQYFYHGEPYLLGIASFMIESTKNSSYVIFAKL